MSSLRQSRARLWLKPVGDEDVDIAQMADAHRCGALELGTVGDEQALPGVLDDRLRDADLAVIEVEECTLLVDGGGADHRIIDLELADQVDSGCADDAAVGAPHRPAGDDHLDVLMRVEQRRDMQVVGDDEQAVMVGERARHLLRGRADIDEERGIVRDQRRRGPSDRRLLVAGDEAARLIGEVFDARRHHRAAMDARHDALVAELVQILSDRLGADLVARRQLLDIDAPLSPGQRHDLALARRDGLHIRLLVTWRQADRAGRQRQPHIIWRLRIAATSRLAGRHRQPGDLSKDMRV